MQWSSSTYVQRLNPAYYLIYAQILLWFQIGKLTDSVHLLVVIHIQFSVKVYFLNSI